MKRLDGLLSIFVCLLFGRGCFWDWTKLRFKDSDCWVLWITMNMYCNEFVKKFCEIWHHWDSKIAWLKGWQHEISWFTKKMPVISVCLSLIDCQRADSWINLLRSVLMVSSSSHACHFVGPIALNRTGRRQIPHNKIKHLKSAYDWWWKNPSVLVSKGNSVIERKRSYEALIVVDRFVVNKTAKTEENIKP